MNESVTSMTHMPRDASTNAPLFQAEEAPITSSEGEQAQRCCNSLKLSLTLADSSTAVTTTALQCIKNFYFSAGLSVIKKSDGLGSEVFDGVLGGDGMDGLDSVILIYGDK